MLSIFCAVIDYIVFDSTNCTVSNNKSFVTHGIPLKNFGLYNAIVREAMHKGIQMQQILSKMCLCRAKIQSYQLKLLKCLKCKSIMNTLYFVTIFYLSLLTNIYDSVCHLHVPMDMMYHWILLYSVPHHGIKSTDNTGGWLSLCEDDRNRSVLELKANQALHMLCKELGILRMVFMKLVQNFITESVSLCHWDINYMFSTGVNVTRTTNSLQF
jgi:hypothetical protein